MWILFETSVGEEGIDAGLLAAEVDIKGHGVVLTAALEDFLAELAGHLLAEDVAGLLEGLVCVSVQNLGPDVAVVAYGVAAAEDVGKVGRTVAGRNLGEQTAVTEDFSLELVDIQVGGNLM